MSKRKYTEWREQPVAWECTNDTCKWQGSRQEMNQVLVSERQGNYVCPKCGNNRFYGLLETPEQSPQQLSQETVALVNNNLKK